MFLKMEDYQTYILFWKDNYQRGCCWDLYVNFELNLQFRIWIMYLLMSNIPTKELLDIADFYMGSYLRKTDLKN